MPSSPAPAPINISWPGRHLSFDPLIEGGRQRAEKLSDARKRTGVFTAADAVMSAIALFSLKAPSLLAFQERRDDGNMKRLFHIQNVPSDTPMRTILDPLEADLFRPMFTDIFRELQRGKALERYVFQDGCYLLSIDGTEYFSSGRVSCGACMQRENKKTGAITYYHQLLGAGRASTLESRE